MLVVLAIKVETAKLKKNLTIIFLPAASNDVMHAVATTLGPIRHKLLDS